MKSMSLYVKGAYVHLSEESTNNVLRALNDEQLTQLEVKGNTQIIDNFEIVTVWYL